MIGLNEAIVLQQIYYWTNYYKNTEEKRQVEKRKHYHDVRWWVYNSKTGWQQNFPFWHTNSVGRVLDSLRKPYTPTGPNDNQVSRVPLLLIGNYNGMAYDRTLLYAIDYDKLGKLELCNPSIQIETMDRPDLTSPSPQPDSMNRPSLISTSPQPDSMNRPSLPPSLPQNESKQPVKMDSPIPETKQRKPEKITEKTSGFSINNNGSSIIKPTPIPVEGLKD